MNASAVAIALAAQPCCDSPDLTTHPASCCSDHVVMHCVACGSCWRDVKPPAIAQASDPRLLVIEQLKLELDVTATWFRDADRGTHSDGEPMECGDRVAFRRTGDEMLTNALNRARTALRRTTSLTAAA